MTDASAVQIIKLFGADAPRLGALTVNNMHDWSTTAIWPPTCV